MSSNFATIIAESSTQSLQSQDTLRHIAKSHVWQTSSNIYASTKNVAFSNVMASSNYQTLMNVAVNSNFGSSGSTSNALVTVNGDISANTVSASNGLMFRNKIVNGDFRLDNKNNGSLIS